MDYAELKAIVHIAIADRCHIFNQIKKFIENESVIAGVILPDESLTYTLNGMIGEGEIISIDRASLTGYFIANGKYPTRFWLDGSNRTACEYPIGEYIAPAIDYDSIELLSEYKKEVLQGEILTVFKNPNKVIIDTGYVKNLASEGVGFAEIAETHLRISRLHFADKLKKDEFLNAAYTEGKKIFADKRMAEKIAEYAERTYDDDFIAEKLGLSVSDFLDFIAENPLFENAWRKNKNNRHKKTRPPRTKTEVRKDLWTPEFIEHIASWGLSVKDTAKRLDMSPATFYNRLAEKKLRELWNNLCRYNTSKTEMESRMLGKQFKDYELLKKVVSENKKDSEVYKILGIHQTTFYRKLKDDPKFKEAYEAGKDLRDPDIFETEKKVNDEPVTNLLKGLKLRKPIVVETGHSPEPYEKTIFIGEGSICFSVLDIDTFQIDKKSRNLIFGIIDLLNDYEVNSND